MELGATMELLGEEVSQLWGRRPPYIVGGTIQPLPPTTAPQRAVLPQWAAVLPLDPAVLPLPLLMLAEKKHVHEIRVNLVQIPDAREKSLFEDTVKNIQIGRQLICFLLRLRVDPQSAVGPESLLVSGGGIAVRTETNWSLKPVIFHPK